jgi:hypothetical protein
MYGYEYDKHLATLVHIGVMRLPLHSLTFQFHRTKKKNPFMTSLGRYLPIQRLPLTKYKVQTYIV